MAPIEETLPVDRQEFMREVGNTRREKAQEQPTAAQEKAQENTDEAQNQINITA